jgi:two-component system phosphate regulon sensor histidine kinase PhoR
VPDSPTTLPIHTADVLDAAATEILGHLEDGVILVDKGQVRWLNPAAMRIFPGLESPAGRPLLEFVRDHRIDGLARRSHEQNMEQSAELELAVSRRVVQVRVVPLSGGLLALVCRDLTRLRYLETVRQQFVANLAHDMRTPLAGIDLAAQTLTAELDSNGDSRAFLDRIMQESQRLQAMLANLSLLAALDDEGVRIDKAGFDANQLAAEIVDRNASRATSKGLRLTLLDGEKTLSAWGDRGKTDQALQNIIDNALKFTTAGEVILGVRADENRIEFSVRDTGPGIPSRDLPRIFERFYKVDRSRGGQPGSGLGLSIARHLIELQGGTITAESASGEGSQFRVRLPRAP